MPFVRVHGNQLAIVHGSRRDGKVVQEVLFTLYSKEEAREAVGQGSDGGAWHFEHMVTEQHPTIRFDWSKVREEIAAKLDHLPDTYDHQDVRLKRDFREALVAFTRQLLLADPQDLDVAAEVLNDQRAELDYVQHWLEWRLRMARERQPSEFSKDNAFLWRYQGLTRDVPHEADEEVHDLYENGKYDEAVTRARLLCEAFPNFADGFNLLGLVALERGEFETAIAQFQKTIEVGRTLFPKRIPKHHWWGDHATRPYMRGLGNLAIAFNRSGRYDEALATCDQLALCHDEIRVSAHRGPVLLNLGRYEEAAACFRMLLGLWPENGYELAFALVSMGQTGEARLPLLRAILHHPRTALRLAGKRVPRPTNRREWMDDEQARTLQLDLPRYLARESQKALAPLRRLIREPAVGAVIAEIGDLEAQESQRRGDDRTVFDRLNEIRSDGFVRSLAADLRA